MINYVGIENKIVECIFEISGSYKIGSYLPGTLIPVIEETKKDLNNYDYLLIFSWHIYKELKHVLRKRVIEENLLFPCHIQKS